MAFLEAVATPLQIEAFFAFLCILWVALFVLFIVAGIWVYRDAESRGMDGTLWALGVVIGGLLGLIIGIVVLIVYVVVRSDHPVGGYRYPPYAPYGAYPPGAYPPPGAYGPPGGTPPPPGTMGPAGPAPVAPPAAPPAAASLTCRACGTAIPSGAGFCPNCGAKA
jgi:hypothetical protein